MIMDYRVLQMNTTEEANNYIFRPTRELIMSTKTVYPPPIDLYSVAYTGKAAALDPEELFCIYNSDFPRKEKARSLSVSDIIAYTFPSGERLYLYCDSFGFDPVDFGENYHVYKAAEYLPRTATCEESVRLFYGNKDAVREVTVNVRLLRQGVRIVQEDSQKTVKLTLGEILKVLYVSEGGRRRIRSLEKIKTLQGMQNSGFEKATDYLTPGDPVDESIVAYFRGSSILAIDKPGYLQVETHHEGNASEENSQKPYFLTFAQKGLQWNYIGLCCCGETENQIPPQAINDLFLKIISQ